MTLKDALTTMAARDDVRGPDNILETAAAASVATIQQSARRTSRSRRTTRLVAAAAVATMLIGVGALAIISSQRDSTTVTANGTDRPAEAADQPSLADSLTRAPDIDPALIPTMRRVTDGTTLGYISTDPKPDGRVIPALRPIFDERGQQIAWWGNSLAWLPFERIEDPSFNYEAEYRAFWAEQDRLLATQVPEDRQISTGD